MTSSPGDAEGHQGDEQRLGFTEATVMVLFARCIHQFAFEVQPLRGP